MEFDSAAAFLFFFAFRCEDEMNESIEFHFRRMFPHSDSADRVRAFIR